MKDSDITQALSSAASGGKPALDRLMHLVYDELRGMASSILRRESRGHTLQATDLVNEAFLKLVDQTRTNWQGKTHFFAVSAQAMRRILVDYARKKHRQKRGGGRKRIQLRDDHALSTERPEEILAIDEAIEKLSKLQPVHARILEYRLFAGMSFAEIAAALDVSTRTIERQWLVIGAWTRRELAAHNDL